MPKIRYDIIDDRTGFQQQWTGVFADEQDAKVWWNKWGKWWKARGKKLKRVICN